MNDPSNDNFVSFRNQNFPEGTSVLEKYKNFNNPEANSGAPSSNAQFVEAYTAEPDAEDLNEDQSLNESESYFAYEIPFNRRVGTNGFEIDFDIADPNNLITDTIVTGSGSQREIWYRFKIPLSEWDYRVGSIQDFRSIQFIRTYVEGWNARTTLRFASLDLVRNQWRRFNGNEMCEGDIVSNNSIFEIDDVNIEENSSRTPFNYVIPKGIEREQVFSTTANVLQNESSISMKVTDLGDGCRQAIYKLLNLDMRNFERLKMFVHAESESGVPDINPGDLTIFMRIGDDFTRNYYEYEIPLTQSDISLGADNEEEIWKLSNEFDFALTELIELKKERNIRGEPVNVIYPKQVPSTDPNSNLMNTIKVIGNPNLGYAKAIMIGISNPFGNDGIEYSTEVWVNELRVTGLNEEGGVAALARMDLQLADFGNVTVAGNYSSIGWGAIDQKLDQRAREVVTQVDLSGNFELGKFFPEKSGIRIPFYAQYSNTKRIPQYDPNDPDIELADQIKIKEEQGETDYESQVVDFNSIKTFNFTNVRKERKGGGKQLPWNIENFSASYSYTENTHRDHLLEKDDQIEHKAGIDYNYSLKPLYIEPFKKIIKSKSLRAISGFNFNLIPNSFSFSTRVDRQKSERSYRFTDNELFKTWEDNQFAWDRNYNLKWDITRSLKFDFNAQNRAIVDEILYNPLRRCFIDPRTNECYDDSPSDYIWDNVKDFGRTQMYQHSVNTSYSLPTRLIPILEWINARAQYNSTYSWTSGSLRTLDEFGSIIQNGQNITLSADLNFARLYDKSKYLRKINRPTRSARPSRGRDRDPDSGGSTSSRRKKEREVSIGEKILIRPLMLIRQLRLTYTEQRQTVIPGFTQSPNILGLTSDFDAPGWGFIAGIQPDISRGGWLDEAAANGWIVNSPFFNQDVIQNRAEKYDGRLTLEPFNDFRIDVNVTRDYVENHTEIFKYNPVPGIEQFQHQTPVDFGSFTISYYTLNTLFSDDINALFTDFENSRTVFSERIAREYSLRDPGYDPNRPHDADAGYRYGLGKGSSEVLVPAFVSTYSGESPENAKLNVFDILPRPNWNLTYNGLSKMGIFKDLFQTFSLTHGYQNTLSINSYRTDLLFEESINNIPTEINEIQGNYYSEFDIPAVSISEQFTPLLGLRITTVNEIDVTLDFKKSRNLDLRTTSFDLNETKTTEYVVGFGYTIKDMKISFKKKKRRRGKSRDQGGGFLGIGSDKDKKPVSNDLVFAFDFSLRDDITQNHRLDQTRKAVPTRGMKSIRISPAVDYTLNRNLTLRLFFDYNKSTPYTSNSYPITTMRGGVTVRFNLE